MESSVLSAPQNDENQNLIYPNPASNLVNIQSVVGSEVHVFDVFGTLIHDFISVETISSISIEHMPRGVYLVEISYQAMKVKTKLIVK